MSGIYRFRNDNFPPETKPMARLAGDPAEMAGAIRKAIWNVNSDVSVPVVRALGGGVADSVANRRFEMDLLLVFAISALLLAGLGV